MFIGRRLELNGVQENGFSPGYLFASGEQGVWYDPSDFERYMAKGPNVITPNTWSMPSGTSITQEGYGFTVTQSAAANGRGATTIPTIAGRTYELTFTRGTGQSADVIAYARDGAVAGMGTVIAQTTGGASVLVFVATSANSNILFDDPSGPTTFQIANVSVRELTAIDTASLYQDSAGTTPVTAVEQVVGFIADQRYGLARGSELRAGFVPGSVGAPPAAATYNTATGAGTAARTDSANQSFVTLSGLTIGATYEITVQNTGAAAISIRTNVAGTTLVSNITSGQTVTAKLSPVTTGNLAVVNSTDGTTAAFTVVSVKALPGNHATQATTASKPVLRQDGNGKYYLAFDGVDDFLQTGSIDFSGTDKMTVFAGVHKASDAALGTVIEHGVGGVDPRAFTLNAPGGSPSPTYRFDVRDGVAPGAQVLPSGYVAPHTAVLTAQGDYAGTPEAALRVNGTAAIPSTTGIAGNFANLPLYIGRRAGTSLPLNGRLYSAIIRGAASTSTQIASTERYIANKTGVTLP